MRVIKKARRVFSYLLPILIMIGLIPFIENDKVLTVVYIAIITASLSFSYEKKDLLFFLFGFGAMAMIEYVFISTGVEVFTRKSFWGAMPLWLPFLWGYGFVIIKRTIIVLYLKKIKK